jgi:TIR domain
MTFAVTDVRATAEHQIAEAAKALGQSSHRRAVFREIHSGKKRIKTVQEIAEATALPRKRVLEEAVKLVHKQIIAKTKRDGDTAYERDNFYYVHRSEIFRRADQLKRGPSAPKPVAPTAPRARRRTRVLRAAKPASRSCDIFLSHASEDKSAIARPLFVALRRKGVNVWFDEAELTMGDSLRRQIDQGLARCRFGVVILSPKFFAKDWPQKELDGLVARENASGEKAILPVWHKLTKAQVAKFSPTLADRLAGNSKEGVAALVRKIRAALSASPRAGRHSSES